MIILSVSPSDGSDEDERHNCGMDLLPTIFMSDPLLFSSRDAMQTNTVPMPDGSEE